MRITAGLVDRDGQADEEIHAYKQLIHFGLTTQRVMTLGECTRSKKFSEAVRSTGIVLLQTWRREREQHLEKLI